MEHKNILIVFDLDGTLNMTHLHSVPAHQAAMREFGVEPASPEKIIATLGSRSNEYSKVFMPDRSEEDRQEYLKRASELDSFFIEKNGAPYAGVPEALDGLRSRGFKTAVCSNSSERYITEVLGKLRLLPKIDYIQPLIKGSTKCDSLRILLDRISPDFAVMVGDTHYDEDAARVNSIPFIGCLYGYRPHEMGSSYIKVNSPDEIPAAVLKIIDNRKLIIDN